MRYHNKYTPLQGHKLFWNEGQVKGDKQDSQHEDWCNISTNTAQFTLHNAISKGAHRTSIELQTSHMLLTIAILMCIHNKGIRFKNLASQQ